MSKSKIALITGVTGQDGAFLTQLLLSKGYHVHGIKRRSSQINTKRIDHLYKKIQNPDSMLNLHYGDLTDSTNILRLIRTIEPDEIYNLGAQSHVQVSFETPEYTTNVDALGTLRILEAIHLLGLEKKTKFYQASTSELYGKVQETPQSETTPFYPRSPYGVAKLYAYWATVNYREAYGFYGCNGILFNHESPIRGETFVTRKITRTAARIALGIEDCLYVGNLNAQRDWGHAKEYVEGMWRMLQQETPDDFVLATGKMTTVREMARLAFNHADIDIEFEGIGEKEVGRCNTTGKILIKQDPRYYRPAEVELLIGNPEKARKKLGWVAKIGMNELIGEMVAADLYRTEQRHFGKYRSAPSAEELVHEEGGFCAWKRKAEEKKSA